MLEHIGYSLVDENNKEIQFWGDHPGISVSIPDRIILPNSDIVEGALPNQRLAGNYMLVERHIESIPTTEIDVKVGETIEFRENKIVVVYHYDLPELPVYQEYIKKKLAAKRWEVETGGAVINGNLFATDRESQTKYIAVTVAISQSNPQTWSINWKLNNGEFVVLNAQQMLFIINGVMAYVQNSFNKEYEFQQTIDSCTTVEDVMAIDIHEGWPSNVYS